ncbi:MAG: saccharopine dehydrogenase NADP-binding domain-containing protein [Terriglobia bacterium]
MRIFVLGVGATGSLLAHLLARQGHTVWCGDKDTERARRFLGKKSPIPIREVNARNLWAIVRAARTCHLLVNASPAVFNQIVLRAALRLGVHYLDMASHLGRTPFKAEQLHFHQRFQQKNRLALINTGVAPGLTNLLVRRSAEMLDAVEAVHIRLYETTESRDPVSTWSAETAFDAAISRPILYRDARFRFARRFAERERFRFPPPIGPVSVVLAPQDEVATLPHFIALREMEVKFGGSEVDRLRRWYRQGKLRWSRPLPRKRFPRTPTPRGVARLIRRGILHNARFAAAVVVRGVKNDQPLLLRWDCAFPTLYQIRTRGIAATHIAYATAHLAALFLKHFPRRLAGVYPPEALPASTRRAILADARARLVRITLKLTRLKPPPDDEEL